MITAFIQLTAEDRGEIRENALRLLYGKERPWEQWRNVTFVPRHYVRRYIDKDHFVYDLVENLERIILPSSTGLPATPWATPWIPNSQIADVIDVSHGFNWLDEYIGGTQPNDERKGTGGESGQAHVSDGFPTEDSIAPTKNRLDVEPGRIDLGPVVRKVARVYEREYAYEYDTPTTVELFEPEPNPCLLARIAKERRRLRYERAPRVPLDEWADKEKEAKLPPQEPIFIKMKGKPKPAPNAENNALVEMWIEDVEVPVDVGEITRLLRIQFRGATEDEVRNDHVAVWLYQVTVDPETAKKFTVAQKRAMSRRLNLMKKLEEGKCPTGTCPGDRCANPELSYADRQDTHALNLVKNLPEGELVGRYVCYVELDQLRFRLLPDVAQFPGDTEEDRVEAAFEELVRQEMDDAEKLARKNGTSVRAARAARKAAFDAVTEIGFVEQERWLDEHGKVEKVVEIS